MVFRRIEREIHLKNVIQKIFFWIASSFLCRRYQIECGGFLQLLHMTPNIQHLHLVHFFLFFFFIINNYVELEKEEGIFFLTTSICDSSLFLHKTQKKLLWIIFSVELRCARYIVFNVLVAVSRFENIFLILIFMQIPLWEITISIFFSSTFWKWNWSTAICESNWLHSKSSIVFDLFKFFFIWFFVGSVLETFNIDAVSTKWYWLNLCEFSI